MTRVRVALALLVLALAVPIALLVARALASVELERQVRHQAVAERVFDEMERTLSQFLQAEESRPAADYRFYSSLEEGGAAPGGERGRSPLSRPSDLPFVVGHFQIEPDGRFTSPLRPADESVARHAGDWPGPEPEYARTRRAIDELELRVAPFWREARAKNIVQAGWPEVLEEEAPAAGSIADAMQEKQEKKEAAAAPADAEGSRPGAAKKSVSAFEALRSLNRGAQQRLERKQVVRDAPRPTRLAANEPVPRAPSVTEAEAETEREKSSRAGEADSSLGASYSRLRPLAARGYTDDADEADNTKNTKNTENTDHDPLPADDRGKLELLMLTGALQASQADGRVRIILEPMVGQPLGSGQLMLYRTVLVGQQGYRQGVLLDEDRLGQWLEQQVVAGGGLAGSLRLNFGRTGSTGLATSDRYSYAHAFAEPFDDFVLRLGVAPLRGTGSDFSIHALAVLLCIVALVGVIALYRMIAVVVHFAERRNNFVAAVSHELKTPLTSIRMYAEMLRDGLVPSEEKRNDYYRTISDESERLSRLIENVLEFSRVEKGSRDFNLTVGALGDVIAEAARNLQPHVERQGFRLEVRVDDDLPPVRFDRDAVVQMVFNLVDNSIKYAAGGEQPAIVIECRRTDAGGAAVSVRDFGPGVPRKHLTRIFEPFFRIEEELTRSTRGSGIGLALVKELGEAMGAAVSGANADGGGFRVKVAFDPARA
jgi:signal transduction histidine kinase